MVRCPYGAACDVSKSVEGPRESKGFWVLCYAVNKVDIVPIRYITRFNGPKLYTYKVSTCLEPAHEDGKSNM